MGLIVCESLLGSSTIWLVVRTQVCSSRLHEVPKKHLGYNSFRVLHGRDLFIRMAAGSGESPCMFLGPLAKWDKAMGVIFLASIEFMLNTLVYLYL